MRPGIMALGGLGPPEGAKDGSPCCPIPAEINRYGFSFKLAPHANTTRVHVRNQDNKKIPADGIISRR